MTTLTATAPAALAARKPAGARLSAASLLVAVGYMDPGNWATDIAGGTAQGYRLLPVVIGASLLGLAFQLLTVRVAIATGRDLASLSRALLPRPLAALSWLAGEAAILATALAELIGGAIALQLLMGLPLAAGLCVSAAATLLLMRVSASRQGVYERVVNLMIGTVSLAFFALLLRSQPSLSAIGAEALQVPRALQHHETLLLALGIVGATVMPHNLYLHSGLLAERAADLDASARTALLRTETRSTVQALGLALAVNAAILIVAAASLQAGGVVIDSLADAHAALGTVLGGGAALLFAVALYAAGQSSAITGTLAGRLLTRGFRGREESRWLRGLATRLAAVALACVGMQAFDIAPDRLLVLSQVALGVALPFAVLPLLRVALDRRHMGAQALNRSSALGAALLSAMMVMLNLGLVGASLQA